MVLDVLNPLNQLDHCISTLIPNIYTFRHDNNHLKLNSVEHSGGQRVRLDLQKLDQFSIFPGQASVNV